MHRAAPGGHGAWRYAQRLQAEDRFSERQATVAHPEQAQARIVRLA